MEDIGNLIYYILIFVVAIFSWISSSTKKKQHRQTTLPSPFPTENTEPRTTPSPKKRKGMPPPVPKHRRQNSFLSSNFENDNSLALEEENNRLIEDLELNNTDSFRKAIIYSEIFKRKEW